MFPYPFSARVIRPGPLTLGWYDTPRSSGPASGGVFPEFTNCNIGPNNPFRWVVVMMSVSANNPITDCLINGVSAEMIVNGRNTGGSPDKSAAVARMLVPSGPTCNVTVIADTASGSSTGAAVTVFSITGGEQSVYSFHGVNSGNISLPRPAQPSVTFYVHTRNGASSTSITNMTEQTSNLNAFGMNHAVGYLLSDTAGTYSRGNNTDARSAGAVLI